MLRYGNFTIVHVVKYYLPIKNFMDPCTFIMCGFHIPLLRVRVSCIKITSSDIQWFQSKSLCLILILCGQSGIGCYYFQYEQIMSMFDVNLGCYCFQHLQVSHKFLFLRIWLSNCCKPNICQWNFKDEISWITSLSQKSQELVPLKIG